jgi:hypothetical protein
LIDRYIERERERERERVQKSGLKVTKVDKVPKGRVFDLTYIIKSKWPRNFCSHTVSIERGGEVGGWSAYKGSIRSSKG